MVKKALPKFSDNFGSCFLGSFAQSPINNNSSYALKVIVVDIFPEIEKYYLKIDPEFGINK